MSIWVNSETKVVVQGLTGKEGRFHAEKCREYGTQIVAGVTPGKAGQDVDGVPVFNTMDDAVRETGANASLIFVPPPFAADAILEAADSGIEVVVCISEGIPGTRHDPRAPHSSGPAHPPYRWELPRDHHPG